MRSSRLPGWVRLWGLLAVWAGVVAGCEEAKLASREYRRPAAGEHWQRYKPARTVELKGEMLTRGAVVLRRHGYIAVYDPTTDTAQACTIPPGLRLAIRWPHLWWLKFEPGRMPRLGPPPAFRRGFYQNMRTGRRQEITEFDAQIVMAPPGPADQGTRMSGVFRDDWVVTWDPTRKRYRQLHGPSGRWAVLHDGGKLPPGQAVVRFETTNGRVGRITLAPRFYCTMSPRDPFDVFVHDPAGRTWRRLDVQPPKPLEDTYSHRPRRRQRMLTIDGRHYEWSVAPYGPIRTATGMDAETFLRSAGKGRRIPVVEGFPPDRLLPEQFRPPPTRPDQIEAVRALLPKAFTDKHVAMSSVCVGSKIWVIWRKASAKRRRGQALAYPPAASTVVDLQTGQVETHPRGDLKPLGHPIVPVGIWRGYRFADEYVPARRPDGTKVITFMVIRHPRTGKWVRVESLSGGGFGIRGDHAYALLPADDITPWLHRTDVAKLVQEALSE